MVVWRLQGSRHPLINSEGARLTGGRWNQVGTAVIYASENIALAALEVIVHHGGIPEDYVGTRIEIPDDLEIGTLEIPEGWPDVVPGSVKAKVVDGNGRPVERVKVLLRGLLPDGAVVFGSAMTPAGGAVEFRDSHRWTWN